MVIGSSSLEGSAVCLHPLVREQPGVSITAHFADLRDFRLERTKAHDLIPFNFRWMEAQVAINVLPRHRLAFRRPTAPRTDDTRRGPPEAGMAWLAAQTAKRARLPICDPMQIPLAGERSWAEMTEIYYNG